MDDHSVDFLQKKYHVPTERQVRARVSRTTKMLGGGLAVLALVGLFFSYRIAQITHGEPGDITNLSVFSSVANSLARLVGSGDKPLVGEAEDRVNFLLLGVGGAGHDGPQLSDTIVFGSFKPSTHETGLVSLPRDLGVNIPGYGLQKINHANAYGDLPLAAQVVGEVMGEEVHYVVRIDFSGFAKLIDQIGGIDVYVDRSFTDTEYPEYEGSPTYQTVSFAEGWQHMKGEEALQFARSRHGNNSEGSDYARAARQQKIIVAVKDKALSLGVLLNPAKLTRLLDTLASHIDTNISFWEMVRFAKYMPDIDADAIAMEVTDVAGGYIYETLLNGLGSIAMPIEDDWSDFHALADNLFALAPENVAAGALGAAPASTLATVTVEVQNGTAVSGLAYQTAQRLDGSQFRVVQIGNAESNAYARTVIYDFTDGRKALELAELKKFLGADVIATTEGWVYADGVVPSGLTSNTDTAAQLLTSDAAIDFLIIVGKNST